MSGVEKAVLLSVLAALVGLWSQPLLALPFILVLVAVLAVAYVRLLGEPSD